MAKCRENEGKMKKIAAPTALHKWVVGYFEIPPSGLSPAGPG